MEVSAVAKVVTRQAVFTTESGSTYIIRKVGGDYTWERTSHHSDSNLLRSEGGRLLCWPDIKVGEDATMLAPPFDARFSFRLIQTTKVLSYKEDAV